MTTTDQKRTVTMKGNTLTLAGSAVQTGQPAPEVELVGTDLSPMKLSTFRGQRCLVSVVPSLDTSVCNLQTKRFNEEAAKLSDTVVVTVSMDLPFAQKRWQEATGSQNVRLLSDHREAAFGQAFGVLVKELRLLARSVFVLDAEGVIRDVQIVDEMTSEPDYDAVLNALKKA